MSVFVIWDWDATLADTYPVINKAYAHTFEKLGMKDKTLSFDEIKRITSTLQNKDVLECVFGFEKNRLFLEKENPVADKKRDPSFS